jgi:hypothetical protein
MRLAGRSEEHAFRVCLPLTTDTGATTEVAMDYPPDFPAESRAKVEAARIRAGRQFDSKRAKAKWRSEIEALFWRYVLTPFLVFASESACLEFWSADEMDDKCREFLRHLAIDAYYQKGKAAGLGDVTSNLNGSILWEAQQEIEKTSQWRKYENIRLKFAVSRRPTTQSAARRSEKTAQIVQSQSTDRRAMVKNYIEEVRIKKGKRITKKDIWTQAGYENRTEFERWERNDLKRPNRAADKNFTRILREKPHLT